MPKKQKRADGRYSVQIYLGKDETGKRKYKTVYGKTQKEATEAADILKAKLGKGINLGHEKDSLGEWARLWLNFKKTEVSQSHFSGLVSLCKHLEPIAGKSITDIVPWDIKVLLSDLALHNPNTGKPASKKLLQDIKSVISQIYTEAIDNRVVEFNPAQNVKIPKTATKEERKPISAEQMEWIATTEHRAQTPAMIMLYAGLRRGEVIPLTWNDVDFSQRIIRVTKSVEFQNNEPVLKAGAKTKSGIRSVPMPDILFDYLSSIPKLGIYVIGGGDKLLTAGAWRRMWESYMVTLDAKYGIRAFNNNRPCRRNLPVNSPVSKFDPHKGPVVIETFTAHQLRHTYATMLYDADVDVLTAKELLGHSDIKTTLAIYTHLSSLRKEKSILALNDYLNCKSNASQPKSRNA